MPDPEIDVAIVGAGPAGCALALGLQGSGLRVGLVEKPRAIDPAPSGDRAVRAIALSYASRLILARLGAWDALPVTGIAQIHVSQAGGFGHTRISREDLGLPDLGYVVSYDEIAPRLAARIDPGAIRRIQADTAPPARLLVHAEGTPGERAREHDYAHTAIVTTVVPERAPSGTAWERFTPEGPLALLPLGRAYAVVWSRTRDSAAQLMRAPDAAFLGALQDCSGDRAGRFLSVGLRAAAPLVLRYLETRAAAGVIHVGNAAQTLHPVAGQGLNLALRDAWDLARLLRETPREEVGSRELAARYARARRFDAQAMLRATDLLARLFVRRDPASIVVRGAALAGFDLLPGARRLLARSMIYGAAC